MRDALVFGRLLFTLAILLVVASLLGSIVGSAGAIQQLLVILDATTIVSVAYLATVWWRDKDRPRSFILALLLFNKLVITVGVAILSWVTIERLNGTPLPNGATIVSLVIMSFILIVHLTAIVVWWARHNAGEG